MKGKMQLVVGMWHSHRNAGNHEVHDNEKDRNNWANHITADLPLSLPHPAHNAELWLIIGGLDFQCSEQTNIDDAPDWTRTRLLRKTPTL